MKICFALPLSNYLKQHLGSNQNKTLTGTQREQRVRAWLLFLKFLFKLSLIIEEGRFSFRTLNTGEISIHCFTVIYFTNTSDIGNITQCSSFAL